MNSHAQTYEEKKLIRQGGALFGLDARIALAIFGAISVVAGATMVLSMDTTRAKALAGELTDTARAIEGFHHDTETDIFRALTEPTETHAYAALFDVKVLSPEGNLAGKWLGPYVPFTSTVHPTYGELRIAKKSGNFNQDCTPDDTCYLWLVYSSVRPSIVAEVNNIIDNPTETPANTTGRVQWATTGGDTTPLAFRAAKALSMD